MNLFFRLPVFFMLFLLILPQQAATDEWLKEVELLITPLEKERYQALRKRPDRERFQAIFWMRRDPTPITALNEFRVIYEEQRRQALARFPGGGLEAEVLTMLGRPQRIEQENDRTTWHYQTAPFFSPLQPPFSLYWKNGELDRSRCAPDLLVFLDDFSKATLFQPVYVMDPRTLPPAVPDAEDPRHQAVLNLAAADTPTAINFPAALFQAGTEGQATHLGLVFQTAGPATESYAVFLLRHREFAGIEYFYPMQLRPFQSFAGKNFFAWGQAMVPGVYDLFGAVFPAGAQEPWLLSREIEIRKFKHGVFTLGTVLTAAEELPLKSSTIQAFSPYQIADRVFIPLLEKRVKADGRLFLLIPVYHPAVENGLVSLQASYSFKGPQDEFTVETPRLTSPLAGGQTVLTLASELPLVNLESGQWILKLEIKDLTTGKQASQRIDFDVE